MRVSLALKARPTLVQGICLTRTTAHLPRIVTTCHTPPRSSPHSHLRQLTTNIPRSAKMSSSSSVQPRFSADADPATLEAFLNPLLTTNGGRWTLAAEGEALEREFKFKTFAKTWDFMTAVSLQCKLKNHHPEWSNVFNTTFIRWTTHHPKGLSAKDVELASICDALAADFGEVVEQQQQQQQQSVATCGLSGLADRAVGSAGDCCVPKSAKK